MSKKRIAVLGGGMAGLTCAHELSKTQELRDQYEVTVYQMGWRLGGKAASGRDKFGRNLEHGLHVWFGYYENAFGLLQDVYERRDAASAGVLRTWRDAFKPQRHTGVGVQTEEGWRYVSIDWPDKSGVPGDGGAVRTLWGALTLVVGLVENLLTHPSAGGSAATVSHDDFNRPLFNAALNRGRSPEDPHPAIQSTGAGALSPLHAFAAVGNWLSALTHHGDDERHDHLHEIGNLVTSAERAHSYAGGLRAENATERLIAETIHIFAAALRGAIKDLLLPNRPFEAIDDTDFRDWLTRHGADREVVEKSSIVRVVYDISFQYTDGFLDKPDCAAGSALGSIIRMLATYKGSMMYLAQAGFGEAVITPIYQVLLADGVQFRFFHKVVGLGLSEDKQWVQQIRLHRQAEMLDGAEYLPTFEVCGLTCWPSEPHWGQLKGGDDLRAQDVNFESRWCNQPPAGEDTLHFGADFDHVVLAIAMGGYKPLTDASGETDPGICAELAEADARFAKFLTIPLSPTIAMQIWSDRTLDELGWSTGKCATVSGPQLYNIWADMSQVLSVEPDGPRSVHYLCGGFPTTLYAASPSRSDVPALAEEEVKDIAKDWLNASASALWPAAVRDGAFDWDVLSDPEGRTGEARFDAQFWRANIDPTECCVASATGTTTHRLLPWESGFGNLTLTGEGTRHGLNATAVEAAVMSGLAAARSIRGDNTAVPGFDFLMRKPWDGPWGIG